MHGRDLSGGGVPGRRPLRGARVPASPIRRRAAPCCKVEAVGLCGSDVAQFHGVELVPAASVFPVVPGHETVGRVVKLAPDAELGVREGDRVAVDEILSSRPPSASTATPT